MPFFAENSVGIPATFTDAFFGMGIGPIFLERLTCVGTENNLLNCTSETNLGITRCTHAVDVGVRCPGKLLACGNTVQVLIDNLFCFRY